MNLKSIKRHVDDHPGYYHDEEEIKYLVDLFELERDARDKAEVQAAELKRLLAKEEEDHQKTAKYYVDADAYAKFLEKKIRNLFSEIEHGDEQHRIWLKEKINSYFKLQ